MNKLDELFRDFEFNEKTEIGISEINGLKLPEDYLDFMRAHNGGEGAVGEYGYACLFRLEELENVNRDYDVTRNWHGCVVFGSDMGGMLLAYNYEKQVYCEIDACNVDEDTYMTICDSFETFFMAFSKEREE